MAGEPRQIDWPSLDAPHDRALREAVAFICERFEPAGIVATGTIVRGHPDPASDLDICVIHDQPFRQRLQRFFSGVPAEIFVNRPAMIETYFREEGERGTAITAHMYATGHVLNDDGGHIARIRERAAEVLAAGPCVSPAQLTQRRYFAATLFEDAVDVAQRDPATSNLILPGAIRAALEYFLMVHGRFIPGPKRLLESVETVDSALADQVRELLGQMAAGAQLDLACRIADRTIGTRGFFEWESERDTRILDG